MRLEDYQSKTFDEFMGLYDRGSDENCSETYMLDCLNIDFEIGECRTRNGLSSSITLGYGAGNGKVRRTANFITSVGNITLILDDAGNLYTYSTRAGDTATSVRLAMGASATDFAAIQMLGKIFISFHDGKNGLLGTNLKVFIPAIAIANDEFRDAGGAAPSAAGPIVAADGSAGSVLAGTYQIAVVYITSSGNQTPPGPKVSALFTPTSYTAPGSKKINLSNIPTGPTGTVKRQIIITMPNLLDYFFLPSNFGGLINDNITTTAVLNFNALNDLVESADFLFDVLESIPAGVALQNLEGRLAVLGEKANPSIIRMSYTGEPESFDSVDSIIPVNRDAGFELRNAFVIRSVFYACTELGIYAPIDNNDIPANWKVPPIDLSISVPSHGVASFYNTSGIRMARDWTLLVDKSGILLMNGSVIKPPITDNINDLWSRINFLQYHKIVLVVDETNHKVYCSLPIDGSTENNLVIVGDYNKCQGKIPNYKQIRWAIWSFSPAGTLRRVTDIGLYFLAGDSLPALRIGSIDGGGKIWKLDPSVTNGQDEGTSFESYFETSLLFWAFGSIHTFNAIIIRAIGTGELLTSIRGSDNANPTTIPLYDLSLNPGQDRVLKFSFENERGKIKFDMLAGRFVISFLKIFGKVKFQMRPA